MPKLSYVIVPCNYGGFEAFTLEYRRSAVGYGKTPKSALKELNELIEALDEITVAHCLPVGKDFNKMINLMWQVCQ